MKYTCDCINSLFFDFNCVKCGCSNTYGMLYIVPFEGNNFDIEKVNSARAEIVNSFRAGIVPDKCRNCYMLKEDKDGKIDEPLPKELDHLYISHWYHCNCGCIYCCNRGVTKLKITPEPKKSDYYDLLPTIKYLCQEGYVGENTRITTIGGEPTVLSEFDEIMTELTKYTKSNIIILSSGIQYSQAIYDTLAKGNTELIITIDAGNPVLYKKIKRVDAFYQVLENVKKYLKANPKNKNSVYFKYILIKGLNDKKENLEECIKIAKETGINKMYLAIDYNCQNIGKEIPEQWYDLYDYFLSVKDMEMYVYDYCQQILDRKKIF
ncbi:MAG: radical SAM protein [Candidatus Gastranaerophilales bacterium]|nr:radical SAM protein [Candidatus Gastranaerophilales bacterium]